MVSQINYIIKQLTRSIDVGRTESVWNKGFRHLSPLAYLYNIDYNNVVFNNSKKR